MRSSKACVQKVLTFKHYPFSNCAFAVLGPLAWKGLTTDTTETSVTLNAKIPSAAYISARDPLP